MDDYIINGLNESQHEWAVKLLNILAPNILDGVQSMYNESVKLCDETGEPTKYLMTLQKFFTRVPEWNNELIRKECERIVQKSACSYLEDLISCVHITHLKILTSIRTGKTQKKIDIDIPKLDQFIHRVYILCARELYACVYLFEKNVQPLVYQKNRRELGSIVKGAIMDAVRASVPVDQLLRAYLDESTDLVMTKEKDEEKPVEKALSFSDKDMAVSVDKEEELIDAPKTVERLEAISAKRHAEAKAAAALEADEDERIVIHQDGGSDLKLDVTDLFTGLPVEPQVIEPPKSEDAFLDLDFIEVM